jgi:hypothetical protein
MDGPEGHDQFVENSIVLRWLKDVKATRSHEPDTVAEPVIWACSEFQWRGV